MVVSCFPYRFFVVFVTSVVVVFVVIVVVDRRRLSFPSLSINVVVLEVLFHVAF